MKITFILPAIGKKADTKYIRSWQVMEPLTIATLKALTPAGVETEFFDDRIELIKYSTKTDLVAITVETYTACRAYAIAARFKERKIPVVMGGYHAMLMPDEVKLHANAVLIGNAESTWGTLVDDAEHGKLKKEYRGKFGYSNLLPDRSIYAEKKYSSIGLIETGRGCNFACDFCAIMKCYHSTYYPRDINLVVKDITSCKKNFYFFIDDNIVANPKYALELCKAIAPLKIRWSGQGSLTIAQNPELLSWIKKSGCDLLLIGFESLDKNNLAIMNKSWTSNLGKIDDLIATIHNEGISIYATFLFGYDYDTPDSIQKVIEFSLKHGFYFAAFNHVTPFPGTPLYEKLSSEKRLLSEKWWLDQSYKYGDLPFKPLSMTHSDVSHGCAAARSTFFNTINIMRRWLKLMPRNKHPLFSFMFLYSNIMLQREVLQRLELPLGSGLDELPK